MDNNNLPNKLHTPDSITHPKWTKMKKEIYRQKKMEQVGKKLARRLPRKVIQSKKRTEVMEIVKKMREFKKLVDDIENEPKYLE